MNWVGGGGNESSVSDAAEIPPISLAQRSVSSSVQVPLIWAPVSEVNTESSGVVGAGDVATTPDTVVAYVPFGMTPDGDATAASAAQMLALLIEGSTNV